MRFWNRDAATTNTHATTSSSSLTALPDLSHQQIKRATRTRRNWALTTSLFLFIAVIFLVLLQLGGLHNCAVLRKWYFIRLDLSAIVPSSVPNFQLINTIAQTLGIHDFYQVGLWGFCEGYQGEGVTFCSEPQPQYWFNPVEIIRNELLAGASSRSCRTVNPLPRFSRCYRQRATKKT